MVWIVDCMFHTPVSLLSLQNVWSTFCHLLIAHQLLHIISVHLVALYSTIMTCKVWTLIGGDFLVIVTFAGCYGMW